MDRYPSRLSNGWLETGKRYYAFKYHYNLRYELTNTLE